MFICNQASISSLFRDIKHAVVLRSRVWPLWRHQLRDHSTRHRPFYCSDPLESSFYRPISNGLRDIQRQMWRNDWHDLKPLNKGQGHSFCWYQSIPHMTSYGLSTVTYALGRTVFTLRCYGKFCPSMRLSVTYWDIVIT